MISPAIHQHGVHVPGVRRRVLADAAVSAQGVPVVTGNRDRVGMVRAALDVVGMLNQGAPAKPDGFTCSTCQRVTRVCVWQGVTVAKGTRMERHVTWLLCAQCHAAEVRE